MAFYYVRSGGTATGDAGRATTARTGSFATMGASAYYDNVSDVFTVPTTNFASGDVVYVSDAHSHTQSGNANYGESTSVRTAIYSVSDTNADQYSRSAYEETTGTSDFLSVGYVYIKGMDFEVSDDWTVGSLDGLVCEDCTFNHPGDGDNISLLGQGPYVQLINCDITQANNNQGPSMTINEGMVEWFGGSYSNTAGESDRGVQINGTGGIQVFFSGVQFSDSDIDLFVLASTARNVTIHCDGCQIHASVDLLSIVPPTRGQRYLFTHCAATSAPAEYQYYLEVFEGTVQDQDDAGIHRDETTAYPSGEKVSLKVDTNTNCDQHAPLIFDLPARFAALSSASTDTIRIYFASTTTLNDTNCWAELVYPDGTNQHIYTYLSNRNSDLIASGTEHTDDSGSSTWKDGASDLAGYNEYRMDLDTSGDAGADTVPQVRMHIGVASATVYVDTTIDVVA